jgi:hypothetical protein
MIERDQAGPRVFIVAQTIPHAAQNYPTVGDYKTDENGCLTVKVSDMGNRDYEFLVAIHELVEAYLCQKRGITDEEITAFDIEFEAKRRPGDLSEPGDDREAPYGNEHNTATAVERLMCAALGVSWQDYERAVQRLSP